MKDMNLQAVSSYQQMVLIIAYYLFLLLSTCEGINAANTEKYRGKRVQYKKIYLIIYLEDFFLLVFLVLLVFLIFFK